MRKIAATALVVTLVVVAGIVFFGQPVEAQDDQILPGCNLPKSYGRLVTLMNAPNSGLAGQAVFEGEDGGTLCCAGVLRGPAADAKTLATYDSLVSPATSV